MATFMEASMFIMFNMHVHICMHAYMHMCACIGNPHTPTPTHKPIHPTHPSPRDDPPNQLKCCNT